MADRRRIFGAMSTAAALLVAPLLASPLPRLVWNVSASTPAGLYWSEPGRLPELGDWTVLRTPIRVRALAAQRQYLPANVPLVKRVRAVAGQHLCTRRDMLLVNGAPVARQRARDPSGRALPRWRGCRSLARGELLVLGDAADSFDGRYFGPVSAGELIGRAVPIWLW